MKGEKGSGEDREREVKWRGKKMRRDKKKISEDCPFLFDYKQISALQAD